MEARTKGILDQRRPLMTHVGKWQVAGVTALLEGVVQ